MRPTNAAEYAALIRESGLISDDQLQASAVAFEQEHGCLEQAEVRAFAEFLLNRELVTRWQDGKLSAGRYKGFLLAEKYRLLDHLSIDGDASNYLAVHLPTGRRVKIAISRHPDQGPPYTVTPWP